jgi:hypothetical protein
MSRKTPKFLISYKTERRQFTKKQEERNRWRGEFEAAGPWRWAGRPTLTETKAKPFDPVEANCMQWSTVFPAVLRVLELEGQKLRNCGYQAG